MKIANNTGPLLYAIGIAGMGVQQFFYADFRPVFLPAWPAVLPGLPFFAWVFGTLLIATAAAIMLKRKVRIASLFLGGILLLFFCIGHLPYELTIDPYSKHPAMWANALKELALSGGAFLVAGSFGVERARNNMEFSLTSLLEKLIPLAAIFFSIPLISFGIDHFLYTQGLSALVPKWMPDHVFWTYFSAVALIGSGVAIILEIRQQIISLLLGIMLFLWFAMLHLPRAIGDPFVDKGNEVTSALQTLAFSGIAFIIACKRGVKRSTFDYQEKN